MLIPTLVRRLSDDVAYLYLLGLQLYIMREP